jgi:hypothetical protein
MHIREAYVGEYASGKSEVAINRARELVQRQEKVTLVDLDLMEPFYTLGSLKENLEKEGIHVLAGEKEKPFGLGETGNLLQPGARFALRQRGNVIFDVGHGVAGHQALNLVEGLGEESNFQVLAVVNPFRPLTATPSRIISFIESLGRVDGIISNSHLGEATTPADIRSGTAVVRKAASLLNLPLVAVTVAEAFKPFFAKTSFEGTVLRYLKLYFSGKDRAAKI